MKTKRNLIYVSGRTVGFTLIEVLLVLIMLVLVASLGVSTLRGTLVQQQLKFSADQVRGEWLDTRIQAMEEGQIFCMRCQLGGNTIIIDRILDVHFTAGLSSRQTSSRYDTGYAYDPFEKGGFTGDVQDFVLRDPNSITEGSGTNVIKLPESVIFADAIAATEERSAFYLGLTAPGETQTDDIEMYQVEAIMTGEIRLGETPGTDGKAWSVPIFFYPDGSTSTAAVLLKNENGRCIEVRLRGLTGTGRATGITLVTDYIGELVPDRFGE